MWRRRAVGCFVIRPISRFHRPPSTRTRGTIDRGILPGLVEALERTVLVEFRDGLDGVTHRGRRNWPDPKNGNILDESNSPSVKARCYLGIRLCQ